MASRTSEGRRPALSTGRKVLFTIIVVVLVCATVEGIARIVWWRLERDSLRTHYMKGEAILANDAINFMKVPDGIYGYKIKPGFRNDSNTVNSQGFRQRGEVSMARAPESLRIVCLGESTTMGTDDQSNYPALLGHILEQQGIGYRQYEVINAGVPGWLSDQIALRVHHQILGFRPDVVILYAGWNDFQSYDPLRPVATESSFVLGYGGTPWMQYANSTSKTLALLSGLWVRRPVPGHTAEEFRDAAANATPPAQRYRFLLKNLADIVQELQTANPSIKIFVCTLAGMWPQTTPDGKMVVPFWVNEHHVTPLRAAQFVDELNAQLGRFAVEHGAGVIDVAAVFAPLDRLRLQWDFAHMYKDGYELVAWTMFRALTAAGIVKARPSDRYEALLSTYREPVRDGAQPTGYR
jgi:lysophospholipase L1-like esterase